MPNSNDAVSRTIACLALSCVLLSAGCSGTMRAAPPAAPSALYRVHVNGRAVTADPGSVLDLLERTVGGSRLGVRADTTGDEPLVVLDGVRLDGVYRLADVPAFHAQSIVVLRPARAMFLYGGHARMGAIVVLTKHGPER